MELHGWWSDEKQPVVLQQHNCENPVIRFPMQVVQWERKEGEWIAWDGEYYHEILFCPYCGEQL